jgi:hypothetical protein
LAGNPKRAFDCSTLHERWSRLQQGYRSIWENTESEDAPALLKELDSRLIEVSNSATSLPIDKKAMGNGRPTPNGSMDLFLPPDAKSRISG